MSVKIKVNKNGSLRVESDNIELYDADGNQYDLSGRMVIGWCRCGQSANKPFCDGSHARCGFDSVVVATTLPPPAPKA
jgi:CDGSH-type Zn-finger protein